MECKYLVLLQEVKNPVCSSSEHSPAREVISRLLEDALEPESSDQHEHLVLKPNTVRWARSVYMKRCFTQTDPDSVFASFL